MTDPIRNKKDCLDALPAEWPVDLMPSIQAQIKRTGRKLVVLDDDPTGTQTVHDVPVLTEWSLQRLTAELRNDYPAFYILTNSRSLPASQAVCVSREIGQNLKMAAFQTGIDFSVASRSDSTLRGHFPAEVDSLADALGIGYCPRLIIPFFEEGGRYTVDDIHYISEGGRLIPAAQTDYARDPAFAYRHSNLKDWVAEKTKGRIPARQVVSLSLNDIRIKGPQRVAAVLAGLADRSVAVVNAASYRDLEVFTTGLLQAESRGQRFLYRAAASFIRVRAGILPKRKPLAREDLIADNTNGGLFVVGSYVPRSTRQVSVLLEQPGISSLEIDVARLMNADTRKKELARAINVANQKLSAGNDLVIYTSRKLLKGTDSLASLETGQRVSDGLVRIVRGIQFQPRYLVAKGGITSSDIATQGLEIRRAMVTGQILPGVPVWKSGPEARYPGMPYIVFPGNVGDADALAVIQKRLAADPGAFSACIPRTAGRG